MDKLERLLNLLAALLDTGRPLTAEELQQRVPGYPDNEVAFRRAFSRDKDSLREMGIPISLIEIPGSDPPTEGYRVRKDDYYLRDPGLDPDELAALQLAASAVRLDGVLGVEGLWKLGGAPGDDEAPELSSIPGDPRLGRLFAAVADRATVTFSYNGEERTVEPHRLDFQRGRWYLTGHDRLRGDERNFRLDRIDGTVSAGRAGSFERPPRDEVSRQAQPWEYGEGEPVEARLVVDPDQASWAIQHVGADSVSERRDDGSVVLALPVTNREAFRSLVVTFLDHAEILDPPELRDDMVEWLRGIAQ
jgi:predicted DNA-binding transcriptional regulator YafY